MSYLKSGLATALIITTISLGACQSAQKTETSTPTTQPSQTVFENSSKPLKPVASPTADEWVIANEETWIPVVDDLGQHLQAARISFLNQDNKAAATQINDAAAFLEQESHQASSEGKVSLENTIADLKKVALEVENGKIKSIQELDPRFVQAYQADTEHLWIVVDEQYWFPVVEKSVQHWQAAHEDFLKKDYLSAAQNIRKGTAFLKLETHRASGEVKTSLLASVEALDQLAKQVKQGQVQNVKVLDDAFAQGQLTAARFYETKAQQAMSDSQFVKTGYDLKAASHHLEAGAAWIGHQKETGLISALKDSRLVAEQLIEGKKPEVTQIDNAIARLGEQTTTFSREAQSTNTP